MTKRDRTGDRRSTNLYRIDKHLRTNGVASRPEPAYLDGWTDRLLVENCRYKTIEPSKPSEATVNTVGLDPVGLEVTTEPMQDLDPDPDAAWILRLHLPACCRQEHHSTTVDLDIDVLDGLTLVEKYGRTQHAAEQILTYWRRHHEHHLPHPRTKEAAEARSDRPEPAPPQPSGTPSTPATTRAPSQSEQNMRQHGQNRKTHHAAV